MADDQAAMAALRALGLLMWQCRLVRDGWRTAQTSNAYLLVPSGTLPPAVSAFHCGGQNGRQSKTLIHQGLTYLPLISDRDREVAREALNQRRMLIEARLVKG